MRAPHVDLRFDYHPLLHSMGLPFRLNGGRKFDLAKSLISIPLGEDNIVNTRTQRSHLSSALRDDPGWLMYVCAQGVVEKPKHIAANVAQRYFERDLKLRWLTHFDGFERVSFAGLSLVVVDTLFFDTSAYRRDKIYEMINHKCNIEDLSVLVIGQHTSPLDMARQLGMRPDLMMLTR